MRIPNPFSSREVDTFARSLARELSQRYPASQDVPRRDQKSERRLARALESVYGKAREYRRENRLGVYRKARLSNVFQWELKELGYSEAFVEETTKGLVVSVSRD